MRSLFSLWYSFLWSSENCVLEILWQVAFFSYLSSACCNAKTCGTYTLLCIWYIFPHQGSKKRSLCLSYTQSKHINCSAKKVDLYYPTTAWWFGWVTHCVITVWRFLCSKFRSRSSRSILGVKIRIHSYKLLNLFYLCGSSESLLESCCLQMVALAEQKEQDLKIMTSNFPMTSVNLDLAFQQNRFVPTKAK